MSLKGGHLNLRLSPNIQINKSVCAFSSTAVSEQGCKTKCYFKILCQCFLFNFQIYRVSPHLVKSIVYLQHCERIARQKCRICEILYSIAFQIPGSHGGKIILIFFVQIICLEILFKTVLKFIFTSFQLLLCFPPNYCKISTNIIVLQG